MNIDKNISLNIIITEIKKNFKKLFFIVFMITSLTLIYLLFFHPKLYKDSITIIHHGNNFSSQSSGFNLMNPLGFALGGSDFLKTPASEVVTSVLKSDKFSKKLLKKDFLDHKTNQKIPLYKIIHEGSEKLSEEEFIHLANKKFKNSIFEVSKDRLTSIINLSVETNDAHLTNDILKEIVFQLNQDLNKLQKETAAQKTNFILQRLENAKNDLLSIEAKYINFQNENKSISQSPSLLIQRKSIERDLNIQTSLVTMLLQQLETTQLEVYDEVHEVLVLEDAEVLPIKTNRRMPILILSVIFSIILSLSYVMYQLIFNKRNKVL